MSLLTFDDITVIHNQEFHSEILRTFCQFKQFFLLINEPCLFLIPSDYFAEYKIGFVFLPKNFQIEFFNFGSLCEVLGIIKKIVLPIRLNWTKPKIAHTPKRGRNFIFFCFFHMFMIFIICFTFHSFCSFLSWNMLLQSKRTTYKMMTDQSIAILWSNYSCGVSVTDIVLDK